MRTRWRGSVSTGCEQIGEHVVELGDGEVGAGSLDEDVFIDEDRVEVGDDFLGARSHLSGALAGDNDGRQNPWPPATTSTDHQRGLPHGHGHPISRTPYSVSR